MCNYVHSELGDKIYVKYPIEKGFKCYMDEPTWMKSL